MKHTPAPWEFKIDGCWLIEANGSSIMGSETYYPWVPSNKADWQLIAAAPELLEALQRFVGNSTAQVSMPSDCEFAESAIAKATGADNGI